MYEFGVKLRHTTPSENAIQVLVQILVPKQIGINSIELEQNLKTTQYLGQVCVSSPESEICTEIISRKNQKIKRQIAHKFKRKINGYLQGVRSPQL